MFAILILIVVGAGFWWVLSPTLAFINGFARLVQNARIRWIIPSFPQSKSSVDGQIQGRAVKLALVHPASNRYGAVVLSMSTHAPDGSPWKDSTLISRNPEISRATFDLEGTYELILTLADGWLEAKWSRPGIMFPGPFDEAKWRNTLQQMLVLVEWLESGSPGARR